ncbi:MAG: ATP-binding cassette domain-containing protein [Bacteroidota bacterium]
MNKVCRCEGIVATGISRFTGFLPHDAPFSPLNYDIGSSGLRLSGGERQRVALARALVRDPSILLMDEVTSEIDLETEMEVVRKIIELRKGKTTVIVAHRLTAAMTADEIVVLSNGKVEELGNHEELISNRRGLYYRLWKASQGNGQKECTINESTSQVVL